MSLLSQFFPSGGGGSGANAIKTNMLLVAGGSGGNPGGGSTPCCVGSGGGGGGGGEVFEFVNYDIAPGSSITVTVGSGGASESNGGNSCVAISGSYTFVAKGGTSGQLSGCTCRLTPVDSCSTFGHNYLSGSKSGGGGGATGQVCITPGPGGAGSDAGSGGCRRANLAGMIYCGRNYSPNLYCSGYSNMINCPSSCVFACLTACSIDYVGEGVVVRPIMGCGGATESKSLSYDPSRGPLAFFGPGTGGGGGGGATSPGTAGGSGCPGNCNPALCWYYICNNYAAGPGGTGGRGHCSTITGASQIYGAGGGGGGGTYGAIGAGAPSPSCYSSYVPSIRGNPGPSGSPYGGGAGGAGSGLTPPYGCPGIFVSGSPGAAGCANTGTGGGGGGHTFTSPTGGCGGSGIVAVQYPNACAAAPAFPGACDCSPATPGYRTYKFNGPGSITLP